MTIEREAEGNEDDAPGDEGGADESAKGGGGGDDGDGGGAGTSARAFGAERYVQFAFIFFAGVLLWFLDKMTTIVWDFFAEPDGLLITAGSAIVAILVTFYLWKHPVVNKLAHEVAGELSKVTWPTKKEVYAATIVVIVTSVIAAILIGLFDTGWSAFTDLIYKF